MPLRVKIDIPLKQGLKLISDWISSKSAAVKIDIPLKQGLKQSFEASDGAKELC